MKTLTVLLLAALLATNVVAQPQGLTKSGKKAIVDSIAKNLERKYVFLDTAERMGKYIQQQLRKGVYDAIAAPTVFADSLTADILSVYHDGHLSISYDPSFSPGSDVEDTAARRTRHRLERHVNFGFDKLEMLRGGIFYIKIGGFFPPDDEAKETVRAVFRLAVNGKALVIDLRMNGGGDPGMVSYMCGFLFGDKTHLNDLYTRSSNTLQQFWTQPNNELPALHSIPVYVLTSKNTFSAGEEFTYDLQAQKRATVIGETTGGGAHPVWPLAVGNGFVANIPFARAINPVTKTNWEAIGVKPDVPVPADDALTVALKMISDAKK